MNFLKITLTFYAVCFFLFGIPAIVAPEWFSETLGYKLASKGALMEFIAAYGGLIIGIGIYLIYCLKTNVISGLVAVLIVMGSLFLGRVIGYGVESEISNVQVIFLIIELTTISLLSCILYSYSNRQKYAITTDQL